MIYKRNLQKAGHTIVLYKIL